MASEQEVVRRLERYLSGRKFKDILVNHSDKEIVAERKSSFFGKRFKVKLTVKENITNVTKIELTVNPHHVVPTANDLAMEVKLRNRINFYL